MITEKDLQEAIAECQGERSPNANTCIKLAAFLTIKEHLYPDTPDPQTYSYMPEPEIVETTITYESDTDFGRLIYGRPQGEVLTAVDELVTTVRVLNPRLYDSFMRRIQ